MSKRFILLVLGILSLCLLIPFVSATSVIINSSYVAQLVEGRDDVFPNMINVSSCEQIYEYTTGDVYFADTVSGSGGLINSHIRAGISFNTSPIPDGATINGVTFTYYNGAKSTVSWLSSGIEIINFTPINATSYTIGDWSKTGRVILSQNMSIANTTEHDYNNLIFNSQGLANINKTGYTTIMLTSTEDAYLINVSASGSYAPGVEGYWAIAYTFPIYLNITYTEPAPSSSFTVDYTGGISPLLVNFTDTSTNTPTVWKWYDGDTLFNSTQNPQYVPFTTGNHQIRLNASNTGGGTNTSVTWINVTDAPTLVLPIPVFSANATTGNAPLVVKFTDTSTDNILGWNWSFGDGENSTDSNPTHTYTTTGLKTVSLEVVNISGYNTTTKTDYINVSATGTVSYLYNKTVNVTGSASTVGRYQFGITLHNTTGTDTVSNLYLGSDVRSDWADVQVTNAAGTNVSFVIFNQTPTSAKLWWNDVNVGTGQTQYLVKYGASGQSTSFANGYATFPLFDDFPGTTLNTTQWTGHGSRYTIANSCFTISGQTTGWNIDGIESKQTFNRNTNPITINFKFKDSTSADKMIGSGTWDFETYTALYIENEITADMFMGGDYVQIIPRFVVNSLYTTEIKLSPSGIWNATTYNSTWTNTVTGAAYGANNQGVIVDANAGGGAIDIDYIYVRNYTGYNVAEPYISAVGAGAGIEAPVAFGNCTPIGGYLPISVTCTDLSTNTPTAWYWVFSGAAGTYYSYSRNPTFNLPSGGWDPECEHDPALCLGGYMNIKLTASNSAGSDIWQVDHYGLYLPTAPTPTPTPTPTPMPTSTPSGIGPQIVSASDLTSNGVNFTVVNIYGDNVWIVYGQNSNGYTWITQNFTSDGGTATAVLQGSPLFGNTKYYAKACDISGCGNEYTFSTVAITPAPATNFGQGIRNILGIRW